MTAEQIFDIVPLTDVEIQFLQSLLPVVQEHGVTVTSTMYKYMFETYPEVRSYFNMTNQENGKQPKVLAFSLYQYILHLNDLTPISGFVNQIVTKHCGLNITPDQYTIVGKCLIHAFQVCLGDAADAHFVSVLTKAYGNLAQTLINAEESLYKTLQWRGSKQFKVVNLVKEADNVTSVYLSPVDSTKLQPFIPGQYITVEWGIDTNSKKIYPREYSISHDLVNNEYRISVRKLADGKVSTFVNTKLQVGDTLPVHAPVGTFTYDSQSSKSKLALLAGGIGITPMITIMEAALKDGKDVELYYSNKTSGSEPFKNTFKKLKETYSNNFKFNEYITEQNKKLNVIDLKHLDPNQYDVYLLGPNDYMHFFKTYLNENGFENVKMEFYGPTDPSV